MTLLNTLWRDDAGAILSAELILIMTLLVVGMVVGLKTVRDAAVTELADVGSAIACLNQSYSYAGCSISCAISPGSQFADQLDTADDPIAQPVGQNSRGVHVCTSAVAEGV